MGRLRAVTSSLLLMTLATGAATASPSTWSGQVKYINGAFPPLARDRLGLCSFNIQWLGHWRGKQNTKLAQLVKNCTIVAIQEMVAPPWDVRVYGDDGQATLLKGDSQSQAFVAAMAAVGFDGVALGPEDTGPTRNHSNGTASEWPVLFYKKSEVTTTTSLPNGYLSVQRVAHPVYSRVPYAFGLRTKDGQDFVVISVHLRASSRDPKIIMAKARRVAEFQLIAEWVEWQKANHRSGEQDYFILGDMNVEDLEEYHGFFGDFSRELDPYVEKVHSEVANVWSGAKQLDFVSLSHKRGGLSPTNVLLNKPYDHIMFEAHELSIRIDDTLEIVDMGKYHGLKNYATTRSFIQDYSDHNPLRMQVFRGGDSD